MLFFQNACEELEAILILKCQIYDNTIEQLVTFLLREAQKAYIHVLKSDLFGDDMLKGISTDDIIFYLLILYFSIFHFHCHIVSVFALQY